MTTIGLYDLKTNLSTVAQRVQLGESYTLTVRGKAVAVINPIQQVTSRQAYIARVRESHKALPKDRVPLTQEELVDMIHESRRS